jgi:LuxR family maltose regulon positive regulatory protein
MVACRPNLRSIAAMVDGSGLLLTKLAPPPVRSEDVHRRRLFERLETGATRRLTLVTTPAGFGKTTLLSSWFTAGADLRVAGQAPILAWLSLEPADNDPARFWAYVLRALQQGLEQTPDHPLMALEMAPLASTESLLMALLNAFSIRQRNTTRATSEESILVLDDYHLITNQAIHMAVAHLLEHLPSNLHLVIASRAVPPLPLTKLRASDQLAELDAADLEFTCEELARFLHSALPLSFTVDEVASVQEQTHGWIMPAHLAALAWRGTADTAAFVASLRGDHHALVEYLATEVFERQPKDIQRFLLATSLLAPFSAPLCDAVLQQNESQRLLEYLERERLFVIPLDDAHHWYRYHTLFAGFLQDRLRQRSSEEVELWRRRAADWYLEQESAGQDAVLLALPHVIALQDWARTTQLIEAAAERMLWQWGEMATMLHWMDEIPRSIVDESPRLALAFAWALTLTGRFDAAEAMLRRVERFSSADDAHPTDPDEASLRRRIAGEALAVRARIAAFHDVDRASALSEQALQRLGHEADLLRADLLLNLGYSQLRRHDLVAAGRAFQAVRRIGRRSGNVRAMMLGSRYLASSYVTRGLLNDAATIYRQALRWATAGGRDPLPVAGTIYVGNAMVLYERNALDAALAQAQQGLALGLRSGEMKTQFPAYLALAQIYQGLGDVARACQALDDAERLSDLRLFSWTEEEIAAARARLYLMRGEVSLAMRALSRNGWRIEGERPIPFDLCPLSVQLAWARVLLAQQRPAAADALLLHTLQEVRTEQPQASALPMMVLRALALAASGDDEQARSLLVGILPSAIAQGYVRTIVDEGAPMAALVRDIMLAGDTPGVDGLLDAFPTPLLQDPPNASGRQSEAPLSAREVEVVRLMAAGLSNQQIADELVIALSTVRTHTKHIYRKLDTRGRVRAVTRATGLGLL